VTKFKTIIDIISSDALTEIYYEKDVNDELCNSEIPESSCLEAISVGDEQGLVKNEKHGDKIPSAFEK
jgi:hypothetical protein